MDCHWEKPNFECTIGRLIMKMFILFLYWIIYTNCWGLGLWIIWRSITKPLLLIQSFMTVCNFWRSVNVEQFILQERMQVSNQQRQRHKTYIQHSDTLKTYPQQIGSLSVTSCPIMPSEWRLKQNVFTSEMCGNANLPAHNPLCYNYVLLNNYDYDL